MGPWLEEEPKSQFIRAMFRVLITIQIEQFLLYGLIEIILVLKNVAFWYTTIVFIC